jgi:hypothetical protein
MCPPAYTITIRIVPIANGANSLPDATANPITRTRKNVHKASVR